ncbi:MAG: sugar ABC transporter substrate-binding protein, partial [Mycobacteriaceae bacterium]|nr:sugar ABC transporter substrate-binding protein [Mycobacteriaceae bacterium]
NSYLGMHGAAVPAVLAAQRSYFDYWKGRGVDVTPFFAVLNGPTIPAPGGPGFPAGYEAYKPYFDAMFLGHLDVSQALAQAQTAANAATDR